MTTVVPIVDGTTVVETGSGTSVVLTNSVVRVSTGSDVDLSNYYTKGETDVLLTAKADVAHVHVVSDITDFSTTVLNGGVF